MEARQNWKFVVESSKAVADGLGAFRTLVQLLSALPELEITEFEEKLKSMWGIAWGLKIRATNLETSTF